MGRIGLPELLVVLAIVIIIFGANRLPEIGKSVGSAIRNFQELDEGRLRRTENINLIIIWLSGD